MLPVEDTGFEQIDLGPHRVEDKFLQADSLSMADIKKYVKEIVAHINELDELAYDEATRAERKRLLVFDTMQTKSILRGIERLTGEKVDEATGRDIEAAIQPIRRAIVEELSNMLDVDEFFILERQLNSREKYDPATMVSELRGPAGKRGVYRDVTHLDPESTLREDLIAAVGVLMHAGEKNAHVIPIASFDEKTGNIVTEHRPMKTLHEISIALKRNDSLSEAQKVGVSRWLLRVVLDGLDGASFLERHGLVMQDLKPENVAWMEDTATVMKGHGVLFDLDGLVIQGEMRLGRYATPGFVPPELRAGAATPVTAKEMSYQFGKILKQIAERKNFMLPVEDMGNLARLIANLTAKSPEKRLSVGEAYTELFTLLKVKTKRAAHSSGKIEKAA